MQSIAAAAAAVGEADPFGFDDDGEFGVAPSMRGTGAASAGLARPPSQASVLALQSRAPSAAASSALGGSLAALGPAPAGVAGPPVSALASSSSSVGYGGLASSALGSSSGVGGGGAAAAAGGGLRMPAFACAPVILSGGSGLSGSGSGGGGVGGPGGGGGIGAGAAAGGALALSSGGECRHLRCTQCDHAVIILPGRAWLPATDYFFFRNNVPDVDALVRGAGAEAGASAYCCQCAWRTVRGRENLTAAQAQGRAAYANDREADLAQLRWVCAPGR